MQYMQVIEAPDVDAARNAYLSLLGMRGVQLMPSMTICVETVHRANSQHGSWLCYLVGAMQHAA